MNTLTTPPLNISSRNSLEVAISKSMLAVELRLLLCVFA